MPMNDNLTPAPNLTLLGNRVLVKPSDADAVTSGGIHIPETSRRGLPRGTVVACGPGKGLDSGTVLPMPVKAGDVVLFERHAGTEVEIDGSKHLVMDAGAIIAVLG